MNHGWTYNDTVSAKDAGKTIVEFYAKRYLHSTENVWGQRCRHGEVERNGCIADADDVLAKGDHLSWHRPPWDEPVVPLAFNVVYEDADLIAVDKPSGLPVLPDGGFSENTLLHQLSLRYPGEKIVPVHRLGRGTSGLLLAARNAHARKDLSAQFRDETARGEGSLHKIYVAATAPCHELAIGETIRIENPIGPVFHPILGTVHAASSNGKRAISICRIRETTPEHTLWEINLITGRPHQIRIHLATIGHPLLGDPLFLPGGHPRPNALPGDTGYYLRSIFIRFRHPRTGLKMEISVPS